MRDMANYIDTRVRPRIAWYDRKAVQYKRITLIIEYLAAAACIGVIVLLHLESVSRFTIACIAALAAFSVSAEKIGQFNNLWHSYRGCVETLEMELQLYRYQSGPYTVAPEARDQLLVERTERILAWEAGKWRSIVESGRAAAEEANLHKV